MYQLIIMDAIFVLGQERIAGFMAGATIRLRDAFRPQKPRNATNCYLGTLWAFVYVQAFI